jgi:hypothetical protein
VKLGVRVVPSGSPVAVKAPTGAVVVGEAPGAVGSTWVSMYWCGGERIDWVGFRPSSVEIQARLLP